VKNPKTQHNIREKGSERERKEKEERG